MAIFVIFPEIRVNTCSIKANCSATVCHMTAAKLSTTSPVSLSHIFPKRLFFYTSSSLIYPVCRGKFILDSAASLGTASQGSLT